MAEVEPRICANHTREQSWYKDRSLSRAASLVCLMSDIKLVIEGMVTLALRCHEVPSDFWKADQDKLLMSLIGKPKKFSKGVTLHHTRIHQMLSS